VSSNEQFQILFDFCGIITKVLLSTEHDFEHFKYYYGAHIVSANKSPDVWIAFTVENESCSFIEALRLRKYKKTILYSFEGSEYFIYEQFIERARLDSILPPINFGRFANTFSMIHGSAITNSVRTVLFLGDSFSGKSVFTLYMSRSAYEFLTDDMCIIHRSDHLVYPISRPVGIRLNTISYLPWLSNLEPAQFRTSIKDGIQQIVASPYTLPINWTIKPAQLTDVIILKPIEGEKAPNITSTVFPEDLLTNGIDQRDISTRILSFSFDNIFPAFDLLQAELC
jgi:hypothetical protein